MCACVRTHVWCGQSAGVRSVYHMSSENTLASERLQSRSHWSAANFLRGVSSVLETRIDHMISTLSSNTGHSELVPENIKPHRGFRWLSHSVLSRPVNKRSLVVEAFSCAVTYT